MKRVILYAMTAKGLATLDKLLTTLGAETLAAVVVGTDQQVQNDYATEIQALASQHHVLCGTRQQAAHILSQLPAGDYMRFAVSWRWLLAEGDDGLGPLVVMHDSPLPRYRGFAPLVNMLINGEPQIGVTSLFASQDYDTGPIIAQATTAVHYPCKIADAIECVSALYAQVALDTVTRLIEQPDFAGIPQREDAATYSLWRDEQDYYLDWSWPADKLARMVDAVSFPYAGAHTWCNDVLTIVQDAYALPDLVIENRTPGKVIFYKNGNPVVVCGTGLLCITALASLADGAPMLPLKRFRSRFSNMRPV